MLSNVSDGEPRDVLEEKAGEAGRSPEAVQLAQAVLSGLGSSADSRGGSSSCPLYDRPLLLPRKGKGWGLSCGPEVGWQVDCQGPEHLDGKREATLQMC